MNRKTRIVAIVLAGLLVLSLLVSMISPLFL